MTYHSFLITPGIWLGEGKISFNSSSDAIDFFTRWEITESDRILTCHQEVEMKGVENKVENTYLVSHITRHSFSIDLSNESIGKVHGKGVIDSSHIAWEIRGQKDFEGFEVFELQAAGDYKFHSEFFSPDQFRTIVDGRLWKKTE